MTTNNNNSFALKIKQDKIENLVNDLQYIVFSSPTISTYINNSNNLIIYHLDGKTLKNQIMILIIMLFTF
jgi:hypothetical protein